MIIQTSLEYLAFNNPTVSIGTLALCSNSGVQAVALCEDRMGFVHHESPLLAMSLLPLYTGVTRNPHGHSHSLSSSKADGGSYSHGGHTGKNAVESLEPVCAEERGALGVLKSRWGPWG